MKKKYKILFALLIVVLVIGCVAFRQVWNMYFESNFTIPEGEKAYLLVCPGMTLDSVCDELEVKGYVIDRRSFELYMRHKHFENSIKTGRYRIENGMTNRTLATRLVYGQQEATKLCFSNARLVSNLASKLSKQLLLDSATIATHLTDTAYTAQLGFTPETIIAMFIPNTYEVYWNISIDDLCKRMQNEYNRFWNEERLQKARNINLTPIEVSTLASIVDAETNIEKDKRIIAGLYMNRMRIGMPLQSCPTAIFAAGDFSITRVTQHETEFDSPYNTYKYRGLPPGPIRMSSVQGIDAVLNFTPNIYIYMCASDKMDGTHNFASNLSEHNRNRAKYKAAYRKWAREHNKTK